MSTIFKNKVKCAVCGAKNEYPCLASTNTFGSPDLDLRPPEMKRSTMWIWVHECPHCGYVSSEVSDPTSVPATFFKTKEYITCDGINFTSELAARFYKYYKINMADQKTEDSFFAILHAAWACDDANDIENAEHCRILSLQLIDFLIEKGDDRTDTFRVLKADIMRRASMFDELKNEYESIRLSDDFLNSILVFQLSRADERDNKCYRVSDVNGNR